MKTLLLSAAMMLFAITSNSQNFSEDFNGSTIAGLVANCWIMNGASTTTQTGEAINGTSIYTAPVPNANAKVDMYTPIQNVTSSSPVIDFDYRLSSALANNEARYLHIGLVNLLGVVTKVDMITLTGGTNTNVFHYSHAFSSVTPGAYRMFIRITGSGGAGNVRLIIDNIAATGSSTVSSGICSFTPIIESTLPVKLTSFTAALNNKNVQLNWITATEINASHFIVERSTDGINFSDAAMVFAYGTTTASTEYNFADNISSIQSGMIYYRLRSVDIDGKYEYSGIRVIKIGKETGNAISILTFPNPVTNEVRVTIPANWQNKKVMYELYNMNGQVARKIETSNSSQTETLSVAGLAPGLYVAKVTCAGEIAQQKIIKQ